LIASGRVPKTTRTFIERKIRCAGLPVMGQEKMPSFRGAAPRRARNL